MNEISQDPKLVVRVLRGRWFDVAAAPALLPSTVRTRIPLPFGQPGGMTVLGSTAWISDWSASQVAVVDLAAGRVTRSVGWS